MNKVTTTQLKSHLFKYLRKAEKGETVFIRHKGVDVAKLVPVKRRNWREGMIIRPKLLMPAEKVFKPMKDIWK